MPVKKAAAKKTTSKPAVIHKTAALQFYWLIYNVALTPDVEALLEETQVEAYTTWKEVIGKGRSGPHFNNDIWPGVNAMYVFAAPETTEAKLAAGIAKIRKEFPGEGIKLIVQPCLGIY